MENYFILLGLSFDPIETNEEVIKKAIEDKRDQWQKEAKNPRKQIQAKENISKIPEIEKIMLNPSTRKIEAEKASKTQQKYISNLKNEILLLSVKGYIEEEEFDSLVNKYEQFSINKNLILKYVTVPIGEDEDDFEFEEIDVLPKDITSQLEMYFNNLGYDDMSIYALYDIPNNSSAELVIQKAQLKLKEMLEKGTKDNKDEIEQKIAGLIINIFQQNQIQYNNYISGFRFYKLNELIKTAISSNKKLTLGVFNALIKICEQEYYFSKKEASQYIIINCMVNKFEIVKDVLLEAERIQNEIEEIEPVIPKELLQDAKEILEQEKKQESKIDTSEIINQMVNPINTLLINNKNKTNQLYSYLKHYKEKREETGSAMSPILSYGSFLEYGLFTIIDIIILFTTNIQNNMISLLFLLAGIIVNIIGITTIYPAFSQWKKMSNCVYNAFKNDEMQDTLYDEFIQLNLNLLLDENKRIKETLNNIKQKSNQLFKDTSKQYETYTRISKIYQQKEYYWKINLTSLVVHVGLFAYVIFLLH